MAVIRDTPAFLGGSWSTEIKTVVGFIARVYCSPKSIYARRESGLSELFGQAGWPGLAA